jgi:hypothetical protein
LALTLRAVGAHYGARARCLRVAQVISGGAVTPVSTGRPFGMCTKLQMFVKNCNQINNLGDFRQILVFFAILGRATGDWLKAIVYASYLPTPVIDPSGRVSLAYRGVDSAWT